MMYVFSDKTLNDAILSWAQDKINSDDSGADKTVYASLVDDYCNAIREFMCSDAVIHHKMTVTVNSDK